MLEVPNRGIRPEFEEDAFAHGAMKSEEGFQTAPAETTEELVIAPRPREIPYAFVRSGTPELTVQVVNYRSQEPLMQCLETFFDDVQGGPSCEVLIADNASGDDLEAIKARFKDKVTITRNTENLGFGAAHNVLSKAATTNETLLFLNPDIEFYEPDTIGRLMNRLHEDPSTVAVGPKLIKPTGEHQQWDHVNYLFDTKIAGKRIRPYFFPVGPCLTNTEPVEVPWVSGAVFMVKRPNFDAVGGFDDKFFLYFEEVDLSRRLINAGGAIVYDPTVTLKHQGAASFSSEAPTPESIKARKGHFIKSFNYAVDKHHLRPVAELLKFFYQFIPDSAFTH
jgi:N-acetylglucosaminyl-diphospho-decaprenol L-rhamnosyltransferase